MRLPRKLCLWMLVLAGIPGCGGLTDGATRIAYAIEAGVGGLAGTDGARHRISGISPAQGSECTGPYTVQFDQVGALIIWCKDASGATVSSHSTTYHGRFVDTAQTFKLVKTAGSTLTVALERRGGRAVVVDVE